MAPGSPVERTRRAASGRRCCCSWKYVQIPTRARYPISGPRRLQGRPIGPWAMHPVGEVRRSAHNGRRLVRSVRRQGSLPGQRGDSTHGPWPAIKIGDSTQMSTPQQAHTHTHTPTPGSRWRAPGSHVCCPPRVASATVRIAHPSQVPSSLGQGTHVPAALVQS